MLAHARMRRRSRFSNLELAGSASDAVAARKLATHRIDALLNVLDVFFSFATPHGLRADYKQRWAAMVPVGRELLANGTIIGFNLGDELVWNCIPSADIATAASTVRADFPRGSALIWYVNDRPSARHGKCLCVFNSG